MVTAAAALFVLSAWLVAWTFTVAGTGRFCGAVYRPAAEIVPTVLLPPGTPFTAQLTAVLGVLVTLAVNCRVTPRKTEAVTGETSMVIGEGGGGGEDPEPPVTPHPSAPMLATSAPRRAMAHCFSIARRVPLRLRNGFRSPLLPPMQGC